MKIKQQELDNWKYENAVETLKPIITSWAKKTLEVARALYIAHEKLSNKGYRNDLIESSTKSEENTTYCQLATGLTDLENCNNTQEVKTFKDFCVDIGISYRTAHRWVSLYDAKSDKLLDELELKQNKEEELSNLFETTRKKRLSEPGWIPTKELGDLSWNKNITSWSDKIEAMYQSWLIRNNYVQINPAKVLPEDPPVISKYGQYGLFSYDYLDSLATKCIEKTEGDAAVDYVKMCNKYKERIPSGIEVNDVMRIPVIVEASLEKIEGSNKKEVLRLLSEILLTMGDEG